MEVYVRQVIHIGWSVCDMSRLPEWRQLQPE